MASGILNRFNIPIDLYVENEKRHLGGNYVHVFCQTEPGVRVYGDLGTPIGVFNYNFRKILDLSIIFNI